MVETLGMGVVVRGRMCGVGGWRPVVVLGKEDVSWTRVDAFHLESSFFFFLKIKHLLSLPIRLIDFVFVL